MGVALFTRRAAALAIGAAVSDSDEERTRPGTTSVSSDIGESSSCATLSLHAVQRWLAERFADVLLDLGRNGGARALRFLAGG